MMHCAAKRRRLKQNQKEPDLEEMAQEDTSHISFGQFQLIFNAVSETWNDFSAEEAQSVFNQTWAKLSSTHEHQLQSEEKTKEESRRKRRRTRSGLKEKKMTFKESGQESRRKRKRRRRRHKRTSVVPESQQTEEVKEDTVAGSAGELAARADEHKPTCSHADESRGVGDHAAEVSEWPKPTRFQRNNLVKQSGVPHINWDRALVAWQWQYPRIDSNGKKNRRTGRAFAVKKFLVPGRSEADADAAALEAAKAFRADLVQQGILSEPKPHDPDFTSEVPGVAWCKRDQKWQVEICQKKGKTLIRGGYFTEKAAAEAKALELREQHGLQRQVRPVSTLAEHLADLAELPVFCPKVPYPGVTWEQKRQKWHAQCRVGGVLRNFRIRPKDHSEEELEGTFQEAVAWKKKQEEEEKAKAKASHEEPKEPATHSNGDPWREELERSLKEKRADAVAAVGEQVSEAAAWPKPTRFRRTNLVKQSGVPHVSWDTTNLTWKVKFPRSDSTGQEVGCTIRTFAVKKFLVRGRSEADADAAALEAAKAFHAELVQQGVLSDPKPRDPNFTSEVPGVRWHKRDQKWQVEICQEGGKKKIHGGYFSEKAAAEAKALELREQHSLGARPKDHSEEELEGTFQEAVAWRKKQEEEKAK
eukprot:Skav235793  [mRNA]  locus=scaffold1267:61483:63575:+ [translate_table: standard]